MPNWRQLGQWEQWDRCPGWSLHHGVPLNKVRPTSTSLSSKFVMNATVVLLWKVSGGWGENHKITHVNMSLPFMFLLIQDCLWHEGRAIQVFHRWRASSLARGHDSEQQGIKRQVVLNVCIYFQITNHLVFRARENVWPHTLKSNFTWNVTHCKDCTRGNSTEGDPEVKHYLRGLLTLNAQEQCAT